MKRFLLIAIAILFVGLVSSCTKDNNVKPAIKATTINTSMNGELGTADGTPPQ